MRYYFLLNKALPGGLNFEYQYIFTNGIRSEIFSGAGYNIMKDINTDFPVDFPDNNFIYYIRLGIGLGYAF